MKIPVTVYVKGKQFRFSSGEVTKPRAKLVKDTVKIRLDDLSQLSDEVLLLAFNKLKKETNLKDLSVQQKVELKYYEYRSVASGFIGTPLDDSTKIFFDLYWEGGKPKDKTIKGVVRVIDAYLFYLKDCKKIQAIEEIKDNYTRDYLTHLRDYGSYSKINVITMKRERAEDSTLAKGTYNPTLVLITSFNKKLSAIFPNIEELIVAKMKRDNNEDHKKMPFTDSEIATIDANFKRMSIHLQHAYKVAFYTGLRLADCFNFGWKNIELYKGMNVLKIKPVKTRHHSKKEPLMIPLPPSLYSYLDINGNKEGDYLFPESRLKHFRTLEKSDNYNYSNVNTTAFGAFLDKIDIKRHEHTGRTLPIVIRSFHGLRHTFARMQIEAGVDLNTLTIMMGHESIEMNQRYSKHVTEHGFKKSLSTYD